MMPLLDFDDSSLVLCCTSLLYKFGDLLADLQFMVHIVFFLTV